MDLVKDLKFIFQFTSLVLFLLTPCAFHTVARDLYGHKCQMPQVSSTKISVDTNGRNFFSYGEAKVRKYLSSLLDKEKRPYATSSFASSAGLGSTMPPHVCPTMGATRLTPINLSQCSQAETHDIVVPANSLGAFSTDDQTTSSSSVLELRVISSAAPNSGMELSSFEFEPIMTRSRKRQIDHRRDLPIVTATTSPPSFDCGDYRQNKKNQMNLYVSQRGHNWTSMRQPAVPLNMSCGKNSESNLEESEHFVETRSKRRKNLWWFIIINFLTELLILIQSRITMT